MASNLDMLIEERQFAMEEGDLDKVAEMDAMIQLHFGNQPQEGEVMGRKMRMRSKGSPKTGEVVSKKKNKKPQNVMRGVGIAVQGTKFSGIF